VVCVRLFQNTYNLLDNGNVIIYEFPFNERVRTLLRLESLFDKVVYFTRAEGALEHHTALNGMFELLDFIGRADPKADMLQELERQRQILLSFRNNPDVSEIALDYSLGEIKQAHAALHLLHGKFGQSLRNNDWLMSIKHKATLPGGASGFDVPSYHYWLKQPSQARRAALEQWQAEVMPIRNALGIILRLLRGHSEMRSLIAQNGQYEQNLSGSSFQMARVALEKEWQVIPEISANRHVLRIRFVLPSETETKSHCADADVPFKLSFCSLV